MAFYTERSFHGRQNHGLSVHSLNAVKIDLSVSQEDVTLFFGVTDGTVSLSSDDVLLLAELYKPDMSSVDVAAYIRDIKSNLARIKRLK